MKANKGQQSPKLQIYLLLSLFNVKSSKNVNMILKNFLKRHFSGIIFTFVDDFTLNSDNNKEF